MMGPPHIYKYIYPYKQAFTRKSGQANCLPTLKKIHLIIAMFHSKCLKHCSTCKSFLPLQLYTEQVRINPSFSKALLCLLRGCLDVRRTTEKTEVITS